jgi:putative spermidine/putrescine transport system permease protein
MSGFRIFAYFVVLLMLLPVLATLPVALTASNFITFPPQGLSLRWFEAVLADDILRRSIVRSLVLATVASLGSIVLGLAAAFAVERGRFRGKTAVETFLMGPRMVPQIILVLALLIYFERVGVAETFTGLVLSHIIIAVPFSFRTVLVSVASVDRRLEWSAAILGATPVRTFLTVVLPQVKTGLIAAFIFTFILSFNNVTMALFLSGIGQRTLPVEMFQRMFVGGMNPAIPAISFLLALAGVGLFILLDRTIGVFKYLGGAR